MTIPPRVPVGGAPVDAARTVGPVDSGLYRDLPRMGLGTWPHVGDDAVRVVSTGLDAGYRIVDTASIYGNEEAVGVALDASGLPRDELFVTTKIRGDDQVSGDVRGALERSLARLRLEYVDLYLIHWPLPRIDRYVATFEAMLTCRDAGLVRHVGVSNFLGRHLRRVVDETGEVPAVDQIQADPTLARASVRTEATRLGTAVQSWSPLGRGDVLAHPAVTAVARRHGCTPAQAVLAWHRAHDIVPIVRSANPIRQAENLAALDVVLTGADVAELDTADRGESAARDVETEEHF